MRARSDRGMSLIEATIVLMVMAILAMLLAPTVGDYVNDARQVAARKDVESIGEGILRLLSDTGSRCLRLAGTTDCTIVNRVDLLVSAGDNPIGISASVTDITLPDSEAATPASVNWIPDGNAPGQQDTVRGQLVQNSAATPYTNATFTGGGPRMKLGWRGAYLSGNSGPDPWNTKYQVNTIFLTVATNAQDSAGSPVQSTEGLREAGWNRDVLVLSSGANRTVETSFGGDGVAGVTAGGDDVIYIIGGSTR